MFIYKYFLITLWLANSADGASLLRAGERGGRGHGRRPGRGYGGGGDHVGGRRPGGGHGRGDGHGDGRAGGDSPRPVVDKPLTMESLLQQRLSSFESKEEMKGWATSNPAELLAEYNRAISTVEELKKVHDSFKLGVFSILCKSGQNGAANDKCPILKPDSPAVGEMNKIMAKVFPGDIEEGDDEWEEGDEEEEDD